MSSKSPLNISKVLLINLPEEGQCADFYTPRYAIDDFSVYPPLGLLYVATVSKAHYPVEIIDVVALRYGIKETADEVIRRSPTVLGISCTTFRVDMMAEIIRLVKAKLPDLIVDDTISFIKEIRPNFIMANTLYPAAKTEIYKDLLKSGKIRKDLWQEFAANPTPNFRLPKWQNKATRNYLKRKLDEIYLTFYLSPSFVIKNMRSDASVGFSFSQLMFKLKLVWLILKSYVTSLGEEKLTYGRERNEIL